MTQTSPPKSGTGNGGPVRTMVVGANDVVADLVSEILESDPRIDLIARPKSGLEAVTRFRRDDVETVVLDAGGAEGDALTTLSRLLRVDPDAKVIMVSTLTFANVKTAMAGLDKGAAEYFQTPAAHTKERSVTVFRHNITETVWGLGLARRRAGARRAAVKAGPAPAIELRRESLVPPKVLVVGSSTGGPQALITLFKNLAPSVTVPVFVAQHMPPGFTASLAANIAEKCGRPCAEGRDGETVSNGRVYVAPGDCHMVVEKENGELRVRINEDPPENFCRPSADPLFRSIVKIFGAGTLAAILTGMGSDGEKGATLIADAGGTVVAQDEATSVVWGMPRAVAVAGVCSAVLPLDDIPAYLNRLAGKAD